MNNIILRGRLTDQADLKISSGTVPVTTCRFTLAVQDNSHKNDEGKYDVDFIKIIAFQKAATLIYDYTKRGSEIIVIGRLHTYNYKDKDARTVYMSEVILEKIEFISNCKKNELEIPEEELNDLPFKWMCFVLTFRKEKKTIN